MSKLKCNICGKPLSDPISIKMEIGPVCRVNLKQAELDAKIGDLFHAKPDFTWDIANGVLMMVDTGQGMSLTNGMELALKEVAETIGVSRLRQLQIMYCDSMGVWDEVVLQGDAGGIGTVGFRPLTEYDRRAAYNKLKKGGSRGEG